MCTCRYTYLAQTFNFWFQNVYNALTLHCRKKTDNSCVCACSFISVAHGNPSNYPFRSMEIFLKSPEDPWNTPHIDLNPWLFPRIDHKFQEIPCGAHTTSSMVNWLLDDINVNWNFWWRRSFHTFHLIFFSKDGQTTTIFLHGYNCLRFVPRF